MTVSLKNSTLIVLSSAALLLLVLPTGCKKGDEGGSSASSAPDASLIAAGKTVFSSNRCQNCHTIEGQGGRKGPELTHTGSDSSHTAQWFADYVKNPKASNPNSRMPSFGGRIQEKDLAALGAYLASLK